MNFSHLNFGNNFVSMHQFSTATKVVGNVQQNIAFIPATNTQHYHNHSNQVSFPNNVQVTTAVIQHQHHYQDASTRILNQNVSSQSVDINTTSTTTTSAQTQWTDGVSQLTPGDNSVKLNLQSFPSHSQSGPSHITQSIQGPIKTILMKDASTMTDFENTDTDVKNRSSSNNGNLKDIVISEDSDESSKSSTNNNQFIQKSSCSNSCSKIHLKSNRLALTEYLLRLKPCPVPQDIQDFLKKHNISLLPTVNKVEPIHHKTESDDGFFAGKPEIRLSNALDGSLLYCCSECHMAYPHKELLERHLSVHQPERRFECNVCGLFLKRKEHLDQHKRGHSEERPFVCDICCKGFKRNEHLRRHIVIHSGDKNHVCPQCGKAFSRKDHLNKHLQTHVGKRVKGETAPSEPTSPLLQLQTQKHVNTYTPKQILN